MEILNRKREFLCSNKYHCATNMRLYHDDDNDDDDDDDDDNDDDNDVDLCDKGSLIGVGKHYHSLGYSRKLCKYKDNF